MNFLFSLNPSQRKQVFGHLAAAAAGALAILSLAPFSFWPAGIAAITLLIFLLDGLSPREALIRGWSFGVGFYGLGASWVYVSIHVYGAAPVLLAGSLTMLFVAGLALMPAAMAWVWQRFFSHSSGAILLGFPSVWVLTEWFRAWFLSGFPWLYLGNAHLDTWLAGWAPMLGVYGISWIVAASGAMFYLLVTRWNRPITRYASLSLVVPLWLAGALCQDIEWTQPTDAPPVEVAVVQGNIPQDLKWAASNLEPTLNTYADLTARHWGADLVVWPEAAVPLFYDRASNYLEWIAADAKATGTTLLTGIPYRGLNPSRPDAYVMHNSVIALGTGDGFYHKQRLVPFGEYVPLENILRGLIQFFDLPMSDFSPGPKRQQGLQAESNGKRYRIAPYICYEIVFPGFVAGSFAGSELLVTISNDAWFGRSAGPAQHLEIAQMRALELGRALVRSTNDGYSALIDYRGRIQQIAPRFEPTVLSGEVQLRDGYTPFARWRSGPALVLSLLLALLVRREPNRSRN